MQISMIENRNSPFESSSPLTIPSEEDLQQRQQLKCGRLLCQKKDIRMETYSFKN